VSGAYLPSLREVHGATPTVTMPELDRIARGGLSYPSFIATQRLTNRGEFALLCGDHPTLVTAEAEMTQLVGVDGSVTFAINMIEERRPLQVWKLDNPDIKQDGNRTEI
jgi:hypothetical protein